MEEGEERKLVMLLLSTRQGQWLVAINKILCTICWILACLLLLVSCSGLEDNRPIDIEERYVHQQISLRAPDFFNTFNTNDAIYLELVSNSNNEITFPNDYNVKIFERKTGDWIEIFEIPTTRLPAADVVLSPTKFRQTTSVAPDLENHINRCQLRIYVIGDMKTDEGIKQVAAYIDLELHP